MGKSVLYSNRFQNELGNAISLEIESEPAPHGGPMMVTISMTGPTSHSTNTITLREASELKAALRKTIL